MSGCATAACCSCAPIRARPRRWCSTRTTAPLLSSKEISVAQIYRAANNPLLDRMIARFRGEGSELIPKGTVATRRAIAALRRGTHLTLLADQKMNDGIPVPFFGRPAMTAPALAVLAVRFDCDVLPAMIFAGTKEALSADCWRWRRATLSSEAGRAPPISRLRRPMPRRKPCGKRTTIFATKVNGGRRGTRSLLQSFSRAKPGLCGRQHAK